MGVVIRVYHNVKKTESEEDYYFIAKNLCDEWNDRFLNLELNAKYIGEAQTDISYSCTTHGWFRKKLAELIGYKAEQWIELDDKILPFAYLFDFADNEGCFDWDIAEKLYQDFKEFELKILSDYKEEFLFIRYYNEWIKLLNIARKNGVVVFS